MSPSPEIRPTFLHTRHPGETDRRAPSPAASRPVALTKLPPPPGFARWPGDVRALSFLDLRVIQSQKFKTIKLHSVGQLSPTKGKVNSTFSHGKWGGVHVDLRGFRQTRLYTVSLKTFFLINKPTTYPFFLLLIFPGLSVHLPKSWVKSSGYGCAANVQTRNAARTGG